MTLQNEQERLVAQTLAVVQRLAQQAAAPLPATSSSSSMPPRLRYAHKRDLRAEMQARLEAFRNRQRFLEIEREAHYQQAMQRIRAVTESYT